MELTLDQALQKGVEAHKAGKVQEADRYYTAILKANPKHPDANHNMGVLAVGVGKLQEALPFFKTALEANSSIAQYWLSYIDALIKLDRMDDAKAVLDQAKSNGADGDGFDEMELRLNTSSDEIENQTQKDIPTQPNILDELKLDKALKLANKKVKDGLNREAKKIYQDILKKFPKNKKALDGIKTLASKTLANTSDIQEPPRGQWESLVNLYTQDLYQEALNKVFELLKQFPNSINLYNIMGAANKGLGKQEEAIEAYTKALSIKPDYAHSYYNIGNTLQDQGKLDEAVQAYNKAISIKPDYTEAYYNMGNTLQDQGKLDEAVQAYNKAISIKPGNVDAHNNIGNALKEQGKLDEAIEAYTKALSIKHDNAEAHTNMGAALKEQGNLDKAILAYNKAISIKPDYAEAYYNMGNALKEQGNLDKAILAYNKAISIKPGNVDAHNNIGNALKEQGNLDEAIEAYNKAISIKHDNAEAHTNMGAALKEQGKLDEAILAYNKAISIKPDYAEAYYNIGNALQEQGKLAEAIEAFNEALLIKPDFTKSWGNLYFPLQAIKYKLKSGQNLYALYPKDVNSNSGKIELSILDYKLHRGQKNASIYLDGTINSLSNVDSRFIKKPEANNNFNKEKQPLTDKMIALVHFGRSGTGLMHSLVDGHPETSTLPSVYFSEYFDHSTWVRITSAGWDGMIDRFISIYEVLFDATSSVPIKGKNKKLEYNIGINDGMANVGDRKDEVLRVDKRLFRKELKHLMACYDELDASIFFKLVHIAHDRAINDRNAKSLIFYHIHNPDTYAQLNFAGCNPNANWLIMIREPIQSLESWALEGFLNKNYSDVVGRIVTMLFEIDNYVYSKQTCIGVRLEDLKEYPQKTIPALCNWMGIEEVDSLYQMTAQGKKWWGDPSSPDFEKDGMDPFGKTSIKRKVGSIFSKNDQFILRTLFYPFSVSFGYAKQNEEQFINNLKTIRPMLDGLFDFEKVILAETKVAPEQFIKSGSYLYLRSVLIEQWDTLDKFGTYSNMIRPLKI